MIPYGRQDISEADIASVVEVLRSEFLTQGPVVPAFEAATAGACGALHAVAANSATSALHIACLALGVGPGDVVWTSPITFVASANCARYCGADVDFVDIDPRTYNLCADRLAEKLAIAKRIGRLPKVIIPVHLAGQPCDMAAINALRQQYGFRIIEDASHAIGGRYRDEPIGNCRYSDITILSFHPVKVITTTEGGMALTNDPSLARTMALLRSHGITREASEMNQAAHGPWYYQQIMLGFNYRMTDVQAALGLSQLSRLAMFVDERHRIAQAYDRALVELPVVTPYQQSDGYSSFHLYVVRLRLDAINRSQREVFDALRDAGVGINLHYIPVHLQPYYQALGFRPGQFPAAEAYYSEALTLPLYPSLSHAEQAKIVDVLAATLTREK
jgi:UDP-4-amino-4,6-dideoxy-N-acetyl-beta-L-altrosamine transaminase